MNNRDKTDRNDKIYNSEQAITRKAIEETLRFLHHSPWENEYLIEVERLQVSVDDPCVLAVAGKVKAGKSSLLNAILEQDLAKVGATATTATINTFRYSSQKDNEHSIRCIYKDGREEWVSREFLDSLQGHDETQLLQTQTIKEIQFYLNLDILRDITLVDTPGTDSEVEEHEKTVQEYLLQTSNADAILYVVGNVPLASDQEFVKKCQEAFTSQQTQAFNTLGIITRIDEDDKTLAEVHNLTENCADKLKGELSGVVAVSAGIWRVLCVDKYEKPGYLENLRQQLKDNFTLDIIDYLLSSSETTWKGEDKKRNYEGCHMSASERIALKGDIPWRVFVVIARRLLKDDTLENIREELEQVSGFPKLLDVLKNQFFARGKLLRCYRILARLLEIVNNKILYRGLDSYHKEIRRGKRQMK